MAPEDFLQEYVEEVREHLQDLERSLLTLEREGTHKGEIQQIFRVAHSIKGASAYMGFERLAGLTHELESLISQIQAEARPVTSKGVSALLSCVDFISSAVETIAETREEPDLPDSLLEELRAFLAGKGAGESVAGALPEEGLENPGPLIEIHIDQADADPLIEAGAHSLFEPADSRESSLEFHQTEELQAEVEEEEDRELYSIFLHSFAEHFAEIRRPLSSSSGQNLSDTEIARARAALERLIASSLYMNYETVAAELREFEGATLPHDAPSDREILLQRYEALAERLRKLLPGLELPPTGTVPEGTACAAEVSVEDDEELLAIYSESFRETFLELASRCAVAPAALPAESEVRTIPMLVERLASSSRYMDFGEAVNVLNEFSRTITEALRNGGVSGELLTSGIATCRERLCKLLPSAALPKTAAAGEAASAAYDARLEDDDEELLTIFIDSFRELFSELIELARDMGKSALSEEDFARTRVLLERMIASSRYMDYEPVTGALLDFEQTVRTLFEPGLARGDILLDAARSTWEKLREILPSLRFPDIEPLETPSLDAGMPLDRAFELTDEDILGEIAKSGNGKAQAETESPMVPQQAREDRVAQPAPPTAEETAGETSSPQPSDGKQARKTHNALSGDETSSSASLRVDALKVDQLLNQVGELVVTRSEFIQTAAIFRDFLREMATSGQLPKSEIKRLRALSFRLNESTQSLGRVANDLQESVMRVRMLPISQLFHRFPRIVRDQSLKLSKKVDLVVEGEETEIDKRVLELMQDPIIQLIRNAIAHGIESPEERKRLGKPETGAIRLAAWHEGDNVVLEIEDDGCGVDIGTLREILKQRRELSENELAKLTDSELVYAIFLPGVSTRSRVDGTAGRGVGLDVVKEKVERMNGSVEVDSLAGTGTRFTIRIPLTVAIIRALLVRSEKQVFTIPLSSISEILKYRYRETHTIEGFQVVNLRGKTVPLVHLGQLFGIGADQQQESQKFIVVVSTSFREVGLVVDGLIGEREVVIKPLEDDYHAFDGFSGATILGDGAVSLILDVSALLKRMNGPARNVEASRSAYVH